jgi:hypothetical protein
MKETLQYQSSRSNNNNNGGEHINEYLSAGSSTGHGALPTIPEAGGIELENLGNVAVARGCRMSHCTDQHFIHSY